LSRILHSCWRIARGVTLGLATALTTMAAFFTAPGLISMTKPCHTALPILRQL